MSVFPIHRIVSHKMIITLLRSVHHDRTDSINQSLFKRCEPMNLVKKIRFAEVWNRITFLRARRSYAEKNYLHLCSVDYIAAANETIDFSCCTILAWLFCHFYDSFTFHCALFSSQFHIHTFVPIHSSVYFILSVQVWSIWCDAVMNSVLISNFAIFIIRSTNHK